MAKDRWYRMGPWYLEHGGDAAAAVITESVSSGRFYWTTGRKDGSAKTLAEAKRAAEAALKKKRGKR